MPTGNLKIDKILARVTDEEREHLLLALNADIDHAPHSRIAKLLTHHGFECSEKAVRTWRQQNTTTDTGSTS